MKRLLCLMGAVLFVSTVFAADVVDTQGYFPIDTAHGITFYNGVNMHRYEFEGKCKIENRVVYVITTTEIGASEPGIKKDVYSFDKSGDIYHLGYITEKGPVKWSKNPALKLKRKMEIGKPYTIEYLNNCNGKVMLTLKGFEDVKLKQVYKQCLVVEKYTSFDKKLAPNSADIKDTFYYAKNIGVIKFESAVFRMVKGKLVQDGRPMSDSMVQ